MTAFKPRSQLETHVVTNVLHAAIGALRDRLVQVPGEHDARHLVEQMAVALQASVLVRYAPAEMADAYRATRLGPNPARVCGAFGAKIDTAAILEHATPAI